MSNRYLKKFLKMSPEALRQGAGEGGGPAALRGRDAWGEVITGTAGRRDKG